ncbi:MAG: glycosyltransferase family 4 protein [Deltaproteobacteria bacterium]|nr:glycosyltransferase family 4 protein [Deltaproteobacteria bacterium]
MNRKIILYIESNTDGTVGGSHFSLLFLIEGLNKAIYEPIVAFYQDNHLIPQYEVAGCRVIMMKKSKPLNIFKIFRQLKIIARYSLPNYVIVKSFRMVQKTVNYFLTFILPSFRCFTVLKREKVDIVHLNNTLLRPQEWILASLLTKAIVVAHERGINNSFPKQPCFWARFLKAIICISDAVKNNLLRHGFPERQLHRIYNGLDPNKFAVCRNKEAVLKELGIANGAPVIGIVGNIKEWKGQETVIHAMKYVRTDFPNVRCLIVGGVSKSDMYYLERLKNIVKSENLEDSVIFTGPRKDVADLVNCLSVLIHASIEPEPFGRTLLEGMALKKPIISTRIGAPLEIVIDGNTGILVEPRSPEKMATAIMKILSDHNLAEDMGRAGYERLLREFNLRKNVELTEYLYVSILS